MKSENLYFVDFGLEHITILGCKIADNKLSRITICLSKQIKIPPQRLQNAFSQEENFNELINIITETEKELKTSISSIILVSKIQSISLSFSKSNITFKNTQKVTQTQKEKLASYAINNFHQTANNEQILDVICNNFVLDDQQLVKNPYKMPCKKLTLNASIISIKNHFSSNLSAILERCKIHVKHYISSCIALYSLIQNELTDNKNYLFIDIGSSTIEFCLFINGCLIYLDRVNLGGLDMTRDISEELGVYINDADKVKKKISQKELQTTNDANTKFVAKQVETIADARLFEIITYVKKTIEENKKLKNLKPDTVFICGGVVKYKNTTKIVYDIFNTKIKILTPDYIQKNTTFGSKIKEEYLKIDNVQLFGALNFYLTNLDYYQNAKRGFLFNFPSKISCLLKDILY